MVHNCNLGAREVEARGTEVQGQPGQFKAFKAILGYLTVCFTELQKIAHFSGMCEATGSILSISQAWWAHL